MAMQAGSHVTWTVGQLVEATQDANDENSSAGAVVEIPRFQRSLVWSDEQRRVLIDSIHRGYPIGSLLLYKRPNPSSEADLYQVVDGLQRTSTLVEYAKRPLSFAPTTLFPSATLVRVANLLEKESGHVQRVLADWMSSTERLDFKAGFSPKKLAARMCSDLEVDPAQVAEDLEDLLGEGLDALRKEVDITGVGIPVVTYVGDESELPEIFERINQRGTKLNKYEVFAATWINSETQVNSEAVRIAINNKYNALLSRGFAISGLELDKKIQDFNLFEYLFGLGKTLVGGHPLLFSEPAEPDPAETEPAAFSLTCVALGQQLSMMKALPKFMPRTQDGLIEPTKMEEALLASAEAVQSWLRPFTGLKLNSGSVDLAHGELQIVSMIARAAVGRWDTRGAWTELPGWKEDWARLEAAMPQHYLMDLVEETWRGPIYTTVFNRVWQTSDDKSSAITGASPHYTRVIDRPTWENALNAWFEKQLMREQRTRPYVRALDRIFLRYVYTNLVSHMADQKTTFELEHLFPVSRLRDEIGTDSSGWPISALPNLALFTKALNREKSSQTISEYVAANNLPDHEQEKLDKYLLCDVPEVSIPSTGLTKDAYVAFLRKRWETMKANLYANLEIPDMAPSESM